MIKSSASILVAVLIAMLPQRGQAASMTLEQKYQDVFVSAGYATAMGAAVGAAVLVFQDDPTDHLRYIAVGASIGFFAGTLMGTYMVVAPSFATDDKKPISSGFNYAKAGAKEHQLIVEPTIDPNGGKLNRLNAGMVLAKF